MGIFKSSPILVICALLLLSVLIRWPAFLNPVRGGHGWLTAHSVLTAQIWKAEGINKYHFSPVYTFPNKSDKNLRSLASGLNDKEGNYYYVSYPPFSFYVAHLFFVIFFIKPSIVGLYILNLFIHLCISILLYILVCKVHNKNYTRELFVPGLIASSLYIFSAQNLLCHIYVYFADSLVQLMWVFYLTIAFLLFKKESTHKWGLLLIFFCANFLLVYTEWLGVFSSLILFLYSLFRSYRAPQYLQLSFIIGASTILSIGLTTLQYSSIDGLQSFLETSVNKYSTRNGYGSDGFYYTKLRATLLLLHYWKFYQANILLLLVFFFLFVISIKRMPSFASDKIFLITVTVLPVLLHHLVFLEFSSMHDFSTLKASIPFCLGIAFIYSSIDFTLDFKATSINKKQMTLFFLVLMILLNITLYYSNERYEPQSMFSQNASIINMTVKPQESIFALTDQDRENGLMVYMGTERAFSPQIQLLTSRNILAIPNRRALIQHIYKYDKSKAKVYLYDQHGQTVGIESYKLH